MSELGIQTRNVEEDEDEEKKEKGAKVKTTKLG